MFFIIMTFNSSVKQIKYINKKADILSNYNKKDRQNINNFDKNKIYSMANLRQATDEFIEIMSSPLSSNDEVNSHLQKCFKYLSDADKKEVDLFMKRVFSLSGLANLERASLATTICGYLVEKGFPSEAILPDLINLYDNLLNKARIFYEMLYAEVRNIDEMDEERDAKINKIFSDLVSDKEVISTETYNSIVSLDKFYACAISLFSINKENFHIAKKRLGEKVAFVGAYNEGCYWIDKLFTVLFDEPVIVIDIDNKVGFKGKINGVVDNYQLQHLLMGIPLLNNGETAISEEDLQVVNGEGEQKTDRSIESKWNMYNLELCEQTNWQKIIDNPSQSVELRNTWIWGEGAPKDISVHNGYRVILLGLPSYSRSSTIQRTFKNLEASIEIESKLTAEEIDSWLK